MKRARFKAVSILKLNGRNLRIKKLSYRSINNLKMDLAAVVAQW